MASDNGVGTSGRFGRCVCGRWRVARCCDSIVAHGWPNVVAVNGMQRPRRAKMGENFDARGSNGSVVVVKGAVGVSARGNLWACMG